MRGSTEESKGEEEGGRQQKRKLRERGRLGRRQGQCEHLDINRFY